MQLTKRTLDQRYILLKVFAILACLIVILSGITSAFAAAGDLKWKYASIYVPAGVVSSPALGPDGTVYVGSLDTYLYAIDSGTGEGLADSPWPMFRRTVDHQGRVEQSEQPTTAVTAESASEQAIPAAYTLSQNHPNPFNPITTIAL